MKIMKFGHIRKFPAAILVIAISLLTGCSSIVNGTTQKVTVRAMNQEKSGMVKVNPDATCQSTNSNGTFESRSTDLVEVHRDNVPLVSICSYGDKAGKTSTESQFRGKSAAGNMFAGGFIGMAIDHATGASYDYPDNIEVVMNMYKTDLDMQQVNSPKPSNAQNSVTQPSVQ